MSRVLVTGGAGYVGSHIVRRLVDSGREVLVLDDLSTGHRAAVGRATFVEADVADPPALEGILGPGDVEFVIHMAASCEVGTSIADPASYYANNVGRGLDLLEACRRHGVRGLVFSSTAAVYGEPRELPIREEHPQQPTNPYGETKLAFERALAWYGRAYGLRHVTLRYFNAAGAHPDGSIGEDHAQESHLIPRLLLGVLGGGEPVPILGEDWPTRDGTCVRDYVHVEDLAQAHVQALECLAEERIDGESLNLGNGEGFTVHEVARMVERVTGRRPPTCAAPRRPGDPAALVACSDRAVARLGWKPAFPALESIISTAWEWHRRHPRGYGDH